MRSKTIIFVRHAESEKNVGDRFSGPARIDSLTARGKAEADAVAKYLESLLSSARTASLTLFSSTSLRACETASVISDKLKVAVNQLDGFESISLGSYQGMTEIDVAQCDPDFFASLSLYRAGVLSSYDIRLPPDAEPLVQFEKRISCALRMIEDSESQLCVVVGQRSPITASLLNYARRARLYPKEFYGYVPLRTSFTSCVDIAESNISVRWVDDRPSADRGGSLIGFRPS